MTENKEMSLPFVSNTRYIDIGLDNDWSLGMNMITNTKSVYNITVPSIKVEFYVHYLDVELHVLLPQGEGDVVLMKDRFSYLRRLATLMVQPYNTIADMVLKYGGELASSYGYSRPPSENCSQVIMRWKAGFALADGAEDGAIHLGLSPFVSTNLTREDVPMATEEDTKMKFLMNKESLLDRDLEESEELEMIPHYLAETSLILGQRVELTTMYWVASMFRYWRGELDIIFRIYSSPLLRTRIGIVIVPPGVAAPFSFPFDGDFITKIVDIAGSTELTFQVPYLHKDPFRFISRTVVSSSETRIMWFYLASITGPSVAPPDIVVTVYMKGPKIEFMVPDLNLAHQWVPESLSVTKSGECYDDLQLLTRRGCLIGRLTSTGFGYSLPVDGFEPVAGGTVTVSTMSVVAMMWSFSTWFRGAYFGYKGGSIYRLMGNTSSVVNYLVATNRGTPGVPNPTTLRQSMGRGGAWVTNEERYIEVSIPDRNRFNFKSTRKRFGGDQECLMIGGAFGALIGDMELIHSAADDVIYCGFLAPPPVLYNG